MKKRAGRETFGEKRAGRVYLELPAPQVIKYERTGAIGVVSQGFTDKISIFTCEWLQINRADYQIRA